MKMSQMMTADEASAMDNSMLQDMEFDGRTFNEIDVLGNLNRDDKGNIIVPTDEKTGTKKSTD